ncbi:hypothetical protein CDAR_574781 [Caerostris darwini]|uniref:Uncharacterized protein n=1 Tax=Caerostris darwini TaxID=1538125 RepID=A0AAV4SZV5_9ARAC|nr:hypothetical protein CDAR_574781 [Caerostris darwini]
MEFKETLIMIYVSLVGLFPNDQNRFHQRISATSVIGTTPNIWPQYATPCQGDQSYLSFSVKMNPDESCPWRLYFANAYHELMSVGGPIFMGVGMWCLGVN